MNTKEIIKFGNNIQFIKNKLHLFILYFQIDQYVLKNVPQMTDNTDESVWLEIMYQVKKNKTVLDVSYLNNLYRIFMLITHFFCITRQRSSYIWDIFIMINTRNLIKESTSECHILSLKRLINLLLLSYYMII